MKLSPRQFWTRLAPAGAIGMTVWVLRVAVVGDLGTGIPYWDQWDREGLVIYEPWLRGHLTWHALFEPHLEHRIVWTHLWNLGLLKLCGQWDPMVQMAAQALFPALVASGCVWGLLPCRSDWKWRTALIGGAVVALGLPFADANILWGFQSSFELLVALSFVVCGCTSLAWRNSAYVWLTLLAGLAAPLAMGAGALAGAIVLVVAGLVILSERRLGRRTIEMIAVGLVCLIWGLYLRSGSTAMAFARAESISTFLLVWIRTLAWPNCRIPWLAGLSCLPVLWLVFRMVRKKKVPEPHELFLVGVAVWAVGCGAGGAWTRGGVDRFPPSRYFEFLSPLSWVNLLALVLVVRAATINPARRIITGGVATLWLGVTLFGDAALLDRFFRARRPAIQQLAGQEFDAVNRVLSGEPARVMAEEGLHPSAVVLEAVMNSPVLAPILPPELQQPPLNLIREKAVAIHLSGDHRGLHWLSGEFEAGMSAMIMFVRTDSAETEWALLDRASGEKIFFRASGRHLGDWAELLVRGGRGLRRLSVETDADIPSVNFVLPRPVSAPGYWIRRASAQWAFWIGVAAVLLGFAAVAGSSCPTTGVNDDASP